MFSLFNLFPKKESKCKLIKDFRTLDFNRNVLSTEKKDFYLDNYKLEFLDYEVSEFKLPIFTIYRNILKSYDKLLFESSNLNFDLFIIKKGVIGREFFKTPSILLEDINGVGSKVLFEVLDGNGYFILQEKDNKSNIKLIKIKKGSRILISKNQVFTIINNSDEKDLLCLALKPSSKDYKFKILEKNFGSCIYLTKNQGFIRNQNYLPNYHLEEFEGDYLLDYSFNKNKTIYKEFTSLPEKFLFLKE